MTELARINSKHCILKIIEIPCHDIDDKVKIKKLIHFSAKLPDDILQHLNELKVFECFFEEEVETFINQIRTIP